MQWIFSRSISFYYLKISMSFPKEEARYLSKKNWSWTIQWKNFLEAKVNLFEVIRNLALKTFTFILTCDGTRSKIFQSGQVKFMFLGSGRVSNFLFGFGKFPLKIPRFSICFLLGQKNLIESGQSQVGLLFTAGQKYARVGSGWAGWAGSEPIYNHNLCNVNWSIRYPNHLLQGCVTRSRQEGHFSFFQLSYNGLKTWPFPDDPSIDPQEKRCQPAFAPGTFWPEGKKIEKCDIFRENLLSPSPNHRWLTWPNLTRVKNFWPGPITTINSLG